MITRERDPEYVARATKHLRQLHNLTQENLADMANVTTRTIEKVESGRHLPNEQTLTLISRAAGVELSWFDKPSPEDEASFKALYEEAKKRSEIVPITPLKTAANFVSQFTNVQGCRFDRSSVAEDTALVLAAQMNDWIDDCMLAWGDFSASEQVAFAREFMSTCGELEFLGYLCFGGRHTARFHGMTVTMAVLCLLPKSQGDETRFALIQLEPGWEKITP